MQWRYMKSKLITWDVIYRNFRFLLQKLNKSLIFKALSNILWINDTWSLWLSYFIISNGLFEVFSDFHWDIWVFFICIRVIRGLFWYRSSTLCLYLWISISLSNFELRYLISDKLSELCLSKEIIFQNIKISRYVVVLAIRHLCTRDHTG